MLGVLRLEWAPEAFLVAFKLETDETILMHKAAKSLHAYCLDAVVANILERRKEEVGFRRVF